MRVDLLDSTGIVVRFPVERRQRPDIYLLNELSALAELNGGVVDCGGGDWPTSRQDGADGVAELVAGFMAQGLSETDILAAARRHVEDLVSTGVARAWDYQDAKQRSTEALEGLKRTGGVNAQAVVDESARCLEGAALASCEAALKASGAYDAVENLASRKVARPSTRDELERDFIEGLEMMHALKLASAWRGGDAEQGSRAATP